MGDSDQSDDEEGSLRRAFEHVKAMREENAVLRHNFEDLKTLYSASLTDKEQLEAQHAAMQEDMRRQSRLYEEQCERWRGEVASKQHALEEAQGQILKAEDVAALRVRVAEQLEGPHRARSAALEQEAEAAHQQALQARRELERLQLEVEAQVARASQALLAQVHELEARVREGDAQVQQMTSAAALQQGNAERCAALERQIEAGHAERGALVREVEAVRAAKERAVVEQERAAIDAERAAHAVRAEAAQQRRQLEALRRRSQHLEGEAQQAHAEREAARQRAGQLEQEHQRASAAAEKTIHALETAVFELEGRLEEAVREGEEQRSEQQAALEEKEALIAGLEAAQREQTANLTHECTLKVQGEEERQRCLRRSLEGEAADLRAAVTALEEDARATEARHTEQRAEAARQLEAAQQQLREGELECAALHGALAEARQEREQAEREAAAARQDAAAAGGESEAARERQRETEKALLDSRQECEWSQQRVERAERQLAELTAVAAAERDKMQAHLEAEKQVQYERGHTSGSQEAHRAARAVARDKEAAKVAALKKKLQRMRHLVAAAAAERAAAGGSHAKDLIESGKWPTEQQDHGSSAVAAGSGNISGWETAWYRNQIDTLRGRQTAFLRA